MSNDAQMLAAMEMIKGEGPSFGASVADAFSIAAAEAKEDLGLDEADVPAPTPKPAAKPAAAPAAPKPIAKPPASSFSPPASDEPATPSPSEADIPPADAYKSKHWKAVHRVMAEMKKEKAALETQLAAMTGTPKPADEASTIDFKRLREERDALSDQLRAIAVEQHPETRAKYGPQLKSVVELGKSLVAAEHRDEVAQWLSQPPSAQGDEAIEAISQHLTPFKQAQLATAVAARNKVYLELGELRANSGQVLAQYQRQGEEQRAAAQSKREAAVKADFEAARSEWSGFSTYAEKPGDAAHNAAAAEARAEAEKIYHGGLTSKELALAAFWVPVGKQLSAQNKALLGRITELEQEAAAYRKADPGGGVGESGASGTIAEAQAEESMSLGEVVLKRLRQGG